MKNTTDNMNQNQEPLNEQQLNELENDAVWSLLDDVEKGASTETCPMFARNVMREIRVSRCAAPVSFWQRFITPKFNKIALTLGAVAACAALVITQIPDQNQNSGAGSLTVDTEVSHDSHSIAGIPIDEISIDDITAFAETEEEDDFTSEMLDLASQDPFYISEEEIEIAMQL